MKRSKLLAAIKNLFTRLFKGKAERTYIEQENKTEGAAHHPNCRHQVPPFASENMVAVIVDKEAPRGYRIVGDEQPPTVPDIRDIRARTKAANEQGEGWESLPLDRVYVNTALADEKPPGARDILAKAKADPKHVEVAIQEAQAAKAEQGAATELTEDQAAWIEGLEAYAAGFELERRKEHLETLLREAKTALQYTKQSVRRKKLEAQVKEIKRQLTALKNKNI